MAERKTEPKLTEAAAKTTAALRTLQSRMSREITPSEARDELGEELQSYFAITAQEPQAPLAASADIRNQVLEKVVDRIISAWQEQDGQISAIKNEVVAQLVERVLAILEST
jgi:GTPase involved in cell partitioning and DNA repair